MAEIFADDKWWHAEQYRRMLNPDFPQEMVDRAMDRVIEVFHSDWQTENAQHPACFYLRARGSMPFVFLFELGIDLLLTSDCLRQPSVIHDLRRASTFSSARTELSLASALTRCGHIIEFRPPLANGKSADLATKDPEQTVYIEIKQLSQSEAQLSLQRLFMALVSTFSELQRREPWSACTGVGYEIEITHKTLGLLGANAVADEATIAAVVAAVNTEVTHRFASGRPPFAFTVGSYACVRIATDANCTLAGPPFAPELELKRIVQKHFKNPTEQLPRLHPGILVIRTGSVLDAAMTRNIVEQLLANQGNEGGHLSAVIFLPVYSSSPVRRSMFRAFAVLNPRAQFPAQDLAVYKSLGKFFDMADQLVLGRHRG
jgi:hypothetical protein